MILDAADVDLEMDADSLAVTAALRIEWEQTDGESPGCIHDFPALPDGAACPDVSVELRYELDRLPRD